MEDKRFAHVTTDPKFRRIPKSERKVKIDKRFQSMFKDKEFKVKYTVDRRGRPINHTATEDLRRYYDLSSEESLSEEENTDDQEPGKHVKAPNQSDNESDFETNDTKINDNDAKISDDVKKKLKNLKVDYARGESKLFSDSSSDDEYETDNLDTDDDIDHKWGELDADAARTDEITHRLAACNMDWDRIRATDLMVLFNSFVPQGGVIKSVIIYPSEFGKERMKEEDIKGPIELIEEETDDINENEEGSKYHMEKLRQYQLNRLKYYYAVVICDSPDTANKIYSECDGMEYESSATKIDLRFIPDDTVFDEEPKEICDDAPDAVKYRPRFFTTTALHQAKVNLTWDETNPERIEITKKLASGKIDDIDENDLQAYLASSSGEEEDEVNTKLDNEENPTEKYRALIDEIETKEKAESKKDVEMEISWDIGLKEKADKFVKQKLLGNKDKTPFQQYLDKRKEKRKEKREERKKNENSRDSDSTDDSELPSDVDMNDPYFAEEFNTKEFKPKMKKKSVTEDKNKDSQKELELELLLMNNDDKKHFNVKKIQDQENTSKSKEKRKKKKVEDKIDDFEVNVDDPRFSALYTSHHFNIDPTDPHYKKTKGTEKLINEKLKRRNEEMQERSSKKPKLNGNGNKDAELNVLVKSVKRKAKAFVNKIP